MSRALQQVKRRIASTRQIRKVTSAMERVAGARLVHDRRVMASSRLYTRRLRRLLGEVVEQTRDPDHVLLRPGAGAPALLLAMGSDRGLCGGYHALLAEAFGGFMARTRPRPVKTAVIGKVLDRRLRRAGAEVVRFLPQPSRAQRIAAVDDLAAFLVAGFAGGSWGEVYVLYMRFESTLKQEAAVERLLPVDVRLEAGGSRLQAACFEPGARAVMESILAEVVAQLLDDLFLNSLASENAARQLAMSRATENAGEMLGELVASYRRLRQERITTEMLELIGGGAGLG
jgi:F-type H+-transporting ATPase subunit gamma